MHDLFKTASKTGIGVRERDKELFDLTSRIKTEKNLESLIIAEKFRNSEV